MNFTNIHGEKAAAGVTGDEWLEYVSFSMKWRVMIYEGHFKLFNYLALINRNDATAASVD